MKGLMARDMIAMGKNRVFLVVMLALCLFYTFSDMYVTGVMLMPMLFSTVCGNMVRNDLSAPIRRTLFTLPFSRREYAGEKYLVSIVPACVLAVMLQMASAVVHRQSITQSGMIAACAVLLTVLTVSVELPVTIIFRDRVQIARVCILAVVFALVAIAVSLAMGAVRHRRPAGRGCACRLRHGVAACVAHSPTVSAGRSTIGDRAAASSIDAAARLYKY